MQYFEMSGRIPVSEGRYINNRCALIALIWISQVIGCGSGVATQDVKNDIPQLNLAEVDFAVADLIREAITELKANPDSAKHWGHLGRVYLAHEFKNEAAQAFAVAAKLEPSSAEWPYYQAHCVILTEPAKAIDFLQASVKQCGNNPAAPRLKLVELLTETNELDRANAHLKDFFAEYPGSGRATLAAAQLDFIRGEFQSCLTRLTKFRGEMNYQRRATELIAEAHRRLGNDQVAARIQQSIERFSNHAWTDPFASKVNKLKTGLKADLVKADIDIGNQKYAETISLLTKTTKNYPQSEWARILLAKAHIKKKQYEPAEVLLREAIEIDAYSVEAQFRLGVVLQNSKRAKEAIPFYEEAVSLKPDFAMAYLNLGICRNETGDLPGAVEALDAVLDTEPNHFQAAALAGHISGQLEQYDQASDYLNRAIALRPNDTWAQTRLREILSKKPDKDSP